MAPSEDKPTGDRQQDITDEIGRKADRKLSARGAQERGVWFGLGMFGLVGWAVAVPTLLGVALGIWLDELFPGRVSWTLTLLFVGIVLGCVNAWYWITQESRRGRQQ